MPASHRPTPVRLTALLAVPAAALATAVAMAAPATAVSADLVVSEVYGGGGNTDAPLRSDYVELANRSTEPVDLTGWTVQYWSASGTIPSTTALSGTIAGRGRYLVKEADGTNTTAPEIPTPDATGTIAMSSSSGRVAVVDAGGTVVDLVGYGSATVSEGSPTPTLSNTTAALRKGVCVDTDNNLADFDVLAPDPQNSSAAPVETCDGGPPPTDDPETIHQIQGAAHLSPLANKPVNGVEGVVTAVSASGFWFQSTSPDDDPATSEGLFVFTRTAPTVAVGDAVSVDGTVAEFRPGGSGGNDNLTTTEISGPTVTTTSTGNPLPTPVVIGVDRVAPPQTIAADNPGNVESPSHTFDVTASAIDFDESLEGMRVAVRSAKAVGPTNVAFGETPVVPGQPIQATKSSFGGVVYGGYDRPNAMRLVLDDNLLPGGIPVADVKDRYAGDTVGVLDYNFADWHLLVTSAGVLKPGGITREVTTKPHDTDLSVATFNVENLAPSDPDTKFARLAGQIVGNLGSPDVLALEEIQDNSGAVDDGTVDSTQTTDKLAAAITDAGGPAYAARWINPTDGTDGGQPGGNIRQVFFYRPDRAVTFVDAPGGEATTPTTVVIDAEGKPHLSASPGRIDPANPAWTASRKPLAGEFQYRGNAVFVIANHFNSKGGDDPLFGRWQPPVRASEDQRHQQATAVRGFVDAILAADKKAKVVVLGDLNDFEFSQTADLLVGSGQTKLLDLPRTLSAKERWTYVFDGNSQVLDHILLSRSLATTGARPAKAYVYDIVHTNAAFHDQDSDHDPQVVHLDLEP